MIIIFVYLRIICKHNAQILRRQLEKINKKKTKMDHNLNFPRLFNKCSKPVVQTVSNIYPEAWKDLDRCDNSTKGVTTVSMYIIYTRSHIHNHVYCN